MIPVLIFYTANVYGIVVSQKKCSSYSFSYAACTYQYQYPGESWSREVELNDVWFLDGLLIG